MHQYRFFDDTGSTLHLYTIYEPVDDLITKLLSRKVELIFAHHCEVFYEEIT